MISLSRGPFWLKVGLGAENGLAGEGIKVGLTFYNDTKLEEKSGEETVERF